MNGTLNGSMNGPARPNMPPSPPHSNNRSSNGSRLYSLSSNAPPSTRKYSVQAMEVELMEHHRVLRAFLDQSLRDDRTYQPHNRARDKLLRLSAIQFQELSTDVYDELLRREDERAAQTSGSLSNRVPRELPPKPNFHPKRNQARQKLATLASRKFRELATDVLYELERRVPRIKGQDINRGASASPAGSNASYNQNGPGARSRPGIQIPPVPYQGRRPSESSPGGAYGSAAVYESVSPVNPDFGRPMAKQLQSNTMVPNKGTMVEDDDDASDATSAYDRNSRRGTGFSGISRLRDSHFDNEQQSLITQLQLKVSEFEGQIKQKDVELSEAHAKASEGLKAEQARSSSILSDLEKQVQSAETLNTNLKQELDRARGTNADLEARLRDHEATKNELERVRSQNEELQEYVAGHNELQEEFGALRGDYQAILPQHEQLRRERDELRGEHDTLNSNHQALQTDFKSWQEDHQSLRNSHLALQDNHQSLQREYTQVRGDHDMLNDIHARSLAEISRLKEVSNKHAELQTRHEELEAKHNDREQAIEMARQESAQTLEELSSISIQHEKADEEREQYQQRIDQLETEVAGWKSRHAEVKTSLRNLKATSMGLDAEQPDAVRALKETSFSSPDGLVMASHVSDYQSAINELLHLARSDDHSAAFRHMRPIVSAVSAIVRDVESSPLTSNNELSQDYSKLKKQISRTTNSLVTTSKLFAASEGLTPLSLVDAAGSDLTASVIAMIKVAKIAPTLTNGGQEGGGEGIGKSSPTKGSVRRRVGLSPDGVYDGLGTNADVL